MEVELGFESHLHFASDSKNTTFKISPPLILYVNSYKCMYYYNPYRKNGRKIEWKREEGCHIVRGAMCESEEGIMTDRFTFKGG